MKVKERAHGIQQRVWPLCSPPPCACHQLLFYKVKNAKPTPSALSALSWVGVAATLLQITGHVECQTLGREVPMGSGATGAKAASSTGSAENTRTHIGGPKAGRALSRDVTQRQPSPEPSRPLSPWLLLSQISVPRLLPDTVTSPCSRHKLFCFFANRGGIREERPRPLTGT